jgi:hypothetical protein
VQVDGFQVKHTSCVEYKLKHKIYIMLSDATLYFIKLYYNSSEMFRHIYMYIYIYRKGENCRIVLVIPDTPVSAILVLQSYKKRVN